MITRARVPFSTNGASKNKKIDFTKQVKFVQAENDPALSMNSLREDLFSGSLLIYRQGYYLKKFLISEAGPMLSSTSQR